MSDATPRFIASQSARDLKLRAERLGVLPAALTAATKRNPWLLTRPIEKLIATRDALARGLHLSDRDADQLWLRSPHLLTRHPELVVQRYALICDALGLSPAELKRIVLDTAALLECPPGVTLARLSAAAAVLELTVTQFVRLGLKQPSLMNFPAQTLAARLVDLAKILSLEPAAAIKLAVRYPEMIVLDPAQARKTLYAIARKLDQPRAAIAAAAARHPALLSADPDALHARLTASCRRLSVAIPDLIAAALKCPPILSLTPANIASKIPLIGALQQASGLTPNMQAALRIAQAAAEEFQQRQVPRRIDVGHENVGQSQPTSPPDRPGPHDIRQPSHPPRPAIAPRREVSLREIPKQRLVRPRDDIAHDLHQLAMHHVRVAPLAAPHEPRTHRHRPAEHCGRLDPCNLLGRAVARRAVHGDDSRFRSRPVGARRAVGQSGPFCAQPNDFSATFRVHLNPEQALPSPAEP